MGLDRGRLASSWGGWVRRRWGAHDKFERDEEDQSQLPMPLSITSRGAAAPLGMYSLQQLSPISYPCPLAQLS